MFNTFRFYLKSAIRVSALAIAKSLRLYGEPYVYVFEAKADLPAHRVVNLTSQEIINLAPEEFAKFNDELYTIHFMVTPWNRHIAGFLFGLTPGKPSMVFSSSHDDSITFTRSHVDDLESAVDFRMDKGQIVPIEIEVNDVKLIEFLSGYSGTSQIAFEVCRNKHFTSRSYIRSTVYFCSSRDAMLVKMAMS